MCGTTVELLEIVDEPKRLLMKAWLTEHSARLNHTGEIYFFDAPFNEVIETIKDFSNFLTLKFLLVEQSNQQNNLIL